MFLITMDRTFASYSSLFGRQWVTPVYTNFHSGLPFVFKLEELPLSCNNEFKICKRFSASAANKARHKPSPNGSRWNRENTSTGRPAPSLEACTVEENFNWNPFGMARYVSCAHEHWSDDGLRGVAWKKILGGLQGPQVLIKHIPERTNITSPEVGTISLLHH